MSLKLNSLAPNFSLPDQNGQVHSLDQYQGQWVLLYFYPKDDTPGCTKEACQLRDQYIGFKKMKAVVLGVSTDSEQSHNKFIDKYNLPFSLLADADKKVVKLYQVWGEKKFMGKTYLGTRRQSFLIDPQGKVRKIYWEVKPLLHAIEVLADIKNLQ